MKSDKNVFLDNFGLFASNLQGAIFFHPVGIRIARLGLASGDSKGIESELRSIKR
jgi:hypothetical protein